MLTRLSNTVNTWLKQRQETQLHLETLQAYQRGEYPENPSIGIGQAVMAGILEPRVLCQHAWTQKALKEGPIYLEAWRRASAGLKRTRKASYYPYLPKNALDVAMSVHEMGWKTGWPASSPEDTRSPAMRLVQWVHDRDPHWIGSNLDTTFFSSSMSVWDTLLYHDPSTSNWIMEKFPVRLDEHKFAWKDWLADTGSWLYPMFNKSFDFPKEQWLEIAEHLSHWSLVQTTDPIEQLNEALTLIGFPGKDFGPHLLSNRGLLWKSMTTDVPTEIADPLGAALACAWPDMHPDCLAIGRHFYPQLVNAMPAFVASLPEAVGFTGHAPLASGAVATASLYESPQAWVQAMMDAWSKTKEGFEYPAVEIELPYNFLD